MSLPSARSTFRTGCTEISKSMMISAIIEIVIITIIFIMLVFAAGYNNKADPTDAEEIAAKDKYISNLIVASAITSLILVLVGIWHIIAANNVKKCIITGSA
ncbi:11K [Dikerogammarus haemobaphes nudivirus]|nr:11K [Dikerogammarus haemobaphes nudivirus]